jgi:hypothetical protein
MKLSVGCGVLYNDFVVIVKFRRCSSYYALLFISIGDNMGVTVLSYYPYVTVTLNDNVFVDLGDDGCTYPPIVIVDFQYSTARVCFKLHVSSVMYYFLLM